MTLLELLLLGPIHEYLLPFFSLIDILSLRQTSRGFQEFFQWHDVWACILEAECLRNDIPLASYNHDTMTVTELEDAAFMPYRFQWGLETQRSINNLRQFALNLWLRGDVRYFHDPPEDADEEDDALHINWDFTPAIACLEFIPGGRFLVSGSESGYLRLWDLAQRVSEPPRHVEYFRRGFVAGVQMPPLIKSMQLQRSVQSASVITIAVLTNTPEDDYINHGVHLRVFRLTLYDCEGERDDPRAEFDLCMISPSLPPSILMWILEGDFVIAVDADMDVLVCNWKTWQWGLIHDVSNCPLPHRHRGGLDNMMASGTHVVLFHWTLNGMIYRLYEMPRMYPTLRDAHSEKTLVQAALFAPGGVHVDVPTTYRPASLHDPTIKTHEHFATFSTVPFVVVTYDAMLFEGSTRLFRVRDFFPSTHFSPFQDHLRGFQRKRPGQNLREERWNRPRAASVGSSALGVDAIDDLSDRERASSLFPDGPVDLRHMKKRAYNDRVWIHPGFDSVFMVFLDDIFKWRLLSVPYTIYEPQDDEPFQTRIDGDNTALLLLKSRIIGDPIAPTGHIAFSGLSGTALYTNHIDQRDGRVYVWEYLSRETWRDHTGNSTPEFDPGSPQTATAEDSEDVVQGGDDDDDLDEEASSSLFDSLDEIVDDSPNLSVGEQEEQGEERDGSYLVVEEPMDEDLYDSLDERMHEDLYFSEDEVQQ